MPNPLVSIIIPVFNSERHLKETISSALSQTWSNKEIIIIDDSSTDDSLQIARGFESTSVKVFSQENKGAAAARNKGLLEANGEYIQFLDADDLLSTNKIAVQINQLLQHPKKIAVCSTVHFFNDKSPYEGFPSAYEDSFLYDTDNPANFLINLYGGNNNHGSMIQTNAWLIPRTIIKDAGIWNEQLTLDDDGEYFCRVVLASKGVVYTKGCFNYYRKYIDGNNLSANKNQKALDGKFRSFLLKKTHLLNSSGHITTKKALARCAMDLMVEAYPAKKLTYQLLKVIEELGGTAYIPQLGGKKIEFIKKTFGWKTAKTLQFYYANIFRNKF